VTNGRGSTLELADQTSAGWMLGWVSCRNVEPARNQFAWNTANDLDNVANGGRAYGMQVLARIQDAPAWATNDGSGRLSQVNPADLQVQHAVRLARPSLQRGRGLALLQYG
jgi:hypothetical protein